MTNRTLSYPCVLQIVGLEPRLTMWQYAEDNAREAGFSLSASVEGGDRGDEARGHQSQRLRIVQGTAEAMPFADGEFDAVVCTLVSEGRGGTVGCTMGFSLTAEACSTLCIIRVSVLCPLSPTLPNLPTLYLTL